MPNVCEALRVYIDGRLEDLKRERTAGRITLSQAEDQLITILNAIAGSKASCPATTGWDDLADEAQSYLDELIWQAQEPTMPAPPSWPPSPGAPPAAASMRPGISLVWPIVGGLSLVAIVVLLVGGRRRRQTKQDGQRRR